MSASRIPLAVPDLGGVEAAALARCVTDNWVSSAGPDVTAFEARLRSHNLEAHIFITRSAKAAADMSSGLKPGSLERFQAALEAAPNFHVVFYNRDAEIFVLYKGTQTP